MTSGDDHFFPTNTTAWIMSTFDLKSFISLLLVASLRSACFEDDALRAPNGVTQMSLVKLPSSDRLKACGPKIQ